MIIESISQVGYLKTRPSAHKLEGITTRQHGGLVLASFPGNYPLTSQQRKVKEAAKACGIHTGMSRSALVTAMTTCIPGKF